MILRICSIFLLLSSLQKVHGQQEKWTSLFNGKNLKGWTEQGMFEKDIQDGALFLKATHPFNNAWVFSKKDYRNFKLELEFLMEDSTNNSGVLFRYNPILTGALNVQAYEVNIDWNADIQGPLGTIEHAARAKIIESLDKTDWNTLRIEATGDHLKSYINGTLVCETHNRRSMTGKLGLQVPIKQGGTIGFRNIKIAELRDSELSIPYVEEYYRTTWERPLKPLFEENSLAGWHTIGEGTWEWTEEGALHGYSGTSASYLVTDEAYQNFYLRCKFRIAKEDNSGIFIRRPPDSAISTRTAIECNIYDHNGMGHAYSTGSIVGHARAWSRMIDYEDWNTMEIFAHETQIILYINGEKASEAYLPASFNKAGNICLQAGTKLFTDNGPSDIYFKDVRLKNMDGLVFKP